LIKIVCENYLGEKMTFSRTPKMWIESVSGLGADYEVTTSKNSGQDGENYTGATASKRNIVMVLDVPKRHMDDTKDRLYSFFQPRSVGILYYYSGNIARKTRYYVESVEPEESGLVRTITISLICPDPKFYALTDNLTELAVWEGLIEWPLEIIEPFEVTRKVNSLISNVVNPSAVPMGLTVTFRASGTVVNPSLYDVNRQELMQVSTTMHAGDQIVITTADGNKHVKLISGGVTSNINNLMAYPPHWLKAYQGDNLFRYNADSSIDSLSVSILSTQAYWGA
jgi:hypothetical protein